MFPFVPGISKKRRLAEVPPDIRSQYLDDKINAAIGLCPEPTHPLDIDWDRKAQRQRGHGANHRAKFAVH